MKKYEVTYKDESNRLFSINIFAPTFFQAYNIACKTKVNDRFIIVEDIDEVIEEIELNNEILN